MWCVICAVLASGLFTLFLVAVFWSWTTEFWDSATLQTGRSIKAPVASILRLLCCVARKGAWQRLRCSPLAIGMHKMETSVMQSMFLRTTRNLPRLLFPLSPTLALRQVGQNGWGSATDPRMLDRWRLEGKVTTAPSLSWSQAGEDLYTGTHGRLVSPTSRTLPMHKSSNL